jgi:hypothetical protein
MVVEGGKTTTVLSLQLVQLRGVHGRTKTRSDSVAKLLAILPSAQIVPGSIISGRHPLRLFASIQRRVY